MKKLYLFSTIILFFVTLSVGLLWSSPSKGQNVGIGTTTPNASAKLDITSTNSGLLPPRMTTAQRDAIANPALGLIIVNTTTNAVEFYNGAAWLNLANAVYASNPLTNKLLGGSSRDDAHSIQQTTDGGYIVAGSSGSSNTGTLTGLNNNGSNDYWIMKLDGSGNIQWQKLFGGSSSDIAYSIRQTTDGGYIVAGSSYSSNTGTLNGIANNGSTDYWIIKLDGNGNIQWQKLLGGSSDDYAQSIQQTTDGGYIVAGFSQSSNTGTLKGLSNNGNYDYLIIKLDGSGIIQWQKLLGGSGSDMANSIRQTTDGGYIVAGGSTSSNTGTLTGLNNNGSNDYWIIKLDGAAFIQWQILLGGSSIDDAIGIHQTSDGGYIVAGLSQSSNTGTLTGRTNNGSNDYWIMKLDGSGNIQWQKLLGGTSIDNVRSIQQTTDGGYIAAGYSASSNSGTLTGLTTNGFYDYWIIKLDGSGNIQWQKLLGGSSSDYAHSIQQTTDGGYIVAGYSQSYNTGTLTGLTNNGSSDYWIIKLDKYGNPL